MGWKYDNCRHRKPVPVTTARTVSQRIVLSWNQLSLAPSSTTYCMLIRKVAIKARPNQSKLCASR